MSAKFQKSTKLNPAVSILLGALVVGTLDITDAIIFFGTRGATPIRVFQSVASGFLGRAAFQGGMSAAVLGGVSHYFIAFGIVMVYYLVGRKFTSLFGNTILFGTVYGLIVFVVMNYVVIPLSAANRPVFVLPVLINGIVGHILLIGIPAVYFAGLAGKSSR